MPRMRPAPSDGAGFEKGTLRIKCALLEDPYPSPSTEHFFDEHSTIPTRTKNASAPIKKPAHT